MALAKLNVRWVLGQSNAQGQGNAALAPPVPTGLMWSRTSTIAKFREPMGRPGPKGDAWAAYCNEEHTHSNAVALWVQTAVGGTSLLPGSVNGDWSPTGSLRYGALTQLNAALAAIAASGRYALGKVEILWIQGENDGSSNVARAAYRDALEELVTWCFANVSALVMFNIIRVGSNIGNPRQQGWANVRAAQEDVAIAMPTQVRMLYRGTFSAQAIGWQPTNSPHYDQDMLNMAGTCAARERFVPTGVPLPLLAPPVNLEQQAALGGSILFTTAAGTEMLIIATRGGSGVPPTVNGIPASFWHNAGGPLWLFTFDSRSLGGASLDGLEVDIESDADHIAVKQLDACCLPDAVYAGTTFLNRPKGGPINLHGLSTGHPALVVYASTGSEGFVFGETSEAGEVTDKVYAPTGATGVVGMALRRTVPGECMP